jgi:hypothetical protein
MMPRAHEAFACAIGQALKGPLTTLENVTGCRKGDLALKMRMNCHYPNGIDSLMLRTV